MPLNLRTVARKNWLIVLLFVILTTETSVVMTQAIPNVINSANNGSVHYGCRDLQASLASNGATVNDTTVRWERFTCPNGHALTVTPRQSSCLDIDGYECAIMIPTFTPPRGLLGLYVVYNLYDDCPGQNPSFPFSKGPPLVSGVPRPMGGPLDYCAVVSRAAGPIGSFTIQWSTGPYRPYEIPSIAISAPNATGSPGQNVTFTLTVTSLRGFEGNVSFTHIGSIQPYPLNGGFFIKPRSVIVPTGGSNSTTLTIVIPSNQPLGRYIIPQYGDAEYGLQFYGDYSGSPTREGNSTNLQLNIT